MLAIVPLLGLFFWYLHGIGVTERWLELSKQYILGNLNVSSSASFLHQFDVLTSQIEGSSWGWIGLLVLLYTVASLIVRFGQSLDMILGTAIEIPTTHWNMFKLTLRRLVVMLGLPIALTLSLVVSQWIRRDSWLRYVFDLGTVGSYFALLIPLTVDVMVFFLVYHFIPRNPVPWKEALRAAVVVGPVSEIVRFLFGLYNSYAVNVHKIYGVLSVIPMFILWLQIAWMVILSGALLIRFRAVRTVAN